MLNIFIELHQKKAKLSPFVDFSFKKSGDTYIHTCMYKTQSISKQYVSSCIEKNTGGYAGKDS